MDKSLILKRIDELRAERNWTINELSSRTNLASGTIYEWYNANKNRTPSLDAIEEICAAFEISLYVFFAPDKESEQIGKKRMLIELVDAMDEEQVDAIIAVARTITRSGHRS